MALKLSVIIPVYNTEKYLKECIDSILNQSFRDYEILLIDDGSTDASGIICEAYAAKYDYISVIHKENGGPAHSRRIGFYASEGEYISFIDSDDTIAPDMYEFMIGKAEEYNADMVICDLLKQTGKAEIPIRNSVEAGFYEKKELEESVYPYLLSGGKNESPGMISMLCNKIIKREILEDAINEVDDRVHCGEDALCAVPCFLNSQRVYICDNTFYYYRRVVSSITHTFNRGRMQELILLAELLGSVFEKRGYDTGSQLNRYTARTAIEYIRSELLFDKESSLKGRIEIIRRFLANPIIAGAFEAVTVSGFSGVNDMKIRLINKERFLTLYLIYYIKNLIARAAWHQ